MPGEGSIYRRASDGRWVATISAGPRGKRKITTVYRHTRGEAIEALGELRKRSGRLDARLLTVSTLLERWLRDADIRPTTRHGYQAVIDTHLDPSIGHLRVAALSPVHVSGLLTDLRGVVKPKTARNALVVLRAALRYAVRKELVSRNVASPEYVDAPKVASYIVDALTHDEEARILAALAGDPIEAHVLVAIGSGLRQGEQLGLAWEDIEGDVIRVRFELARVDETYQRVAPKTDWSRRDVPMSPIVRAALDAHAARYRAANFVPISSAPVFISTTGNAMSGSVLTHRWYDLQARAGVRRRPWKILRATFSSRLYEQGIDEITIANLMGHSRTHTTRKHYIAGGSSDPRAAVAAVLTVTPTDTATVAGVAGSRRE